MPARPESVASAEDDHHLTTAAERRSALARALSESAAARARQDSVEAARWLNRAAWLQFRLIDTDAALASYDEALRLLDPSPDPETEVDSLAGKASVLAHKNKCQYAEPVLDRALAISRQSSYAKGQSATLLVVSECQRNSNQALALSTAEESLNTSRSINDRYGMAKAHQSIGETLLALSRLNEATASLNTALQIWQELDLRDDQTQAIIYLGFVEYRKGAWQSAISFLTDAQNRVDPEADPYKMAQITGTLGEVMNEAGMSESSLPLLQNAAEFFRRADRKSGVVAMEWDLGRTYYALGRYLEAIESLQAGLIHSEPIGEVILGARCHDFLGRSFLALGDTASALKHYEAAVEIFTRGNLRLEVARTVTLMGQLYQSENQLERARERYEVALKTFDDLGDQINQGVTLYALGDLALGQGDLATAAGFLRRSLDVTENMRRNSTSADLTAAFSATVYDRYEKYVSCLMRQHAARPESDLAVKAFEASELGRGRSLAELLRSADTSLVSGLNPELAERERLLRQALRFKADLQVQLLGQPSYKKEELDALKAEQIQLEADYAKLTAEIRRDHPAFGEIVRPAVWTLREIQEQVVSDEQTVLLEYSLGEEKSYVWAVTRDSFSSYELPGRTAIEQAAKAVYAKMSAAPGPTSAAELLTAQRELSRLVLSPVAGQLNKSRIIVVADGVLNYIPFQSLPDPADNARLLVEKYEVINAASASILGALGKESATRPAPTNLLAAFGNPVFQSNYAQVKDSGADTVLLAENDGSANDRWRHALRDIEIDADSPDTENIQALIYSIKELSNLRAVGGGDSLIASEFNASRENVMRTDLSQYSILHFATHGFLDPKRPENSGLVLSTVDSNGKPRNGYLGLQDIYSLRAPVDLVVLSACRTGLGKDVKGEGLIGLTRGFMYAGASTVVASLWKVDDEATAALMKEFYDNLLQKGLPPAAALRAAQNTIRSKPQWSSPYYWAAFTIQGEYRTPLRPTQAPMTPGLARRITAAAAILGLLTLVAWYSRRRLVVVAQPS